MEAMAECVERIGERIVAVRRLANDITADAQDPALLGTVIEDLTLLLGADCDLMERLLGVAPHGGYNEHDGYTVIADRQARDARREEVSLSRLSQTT